MFEPLFKKESKTPKDPKCCKTAAPISLIRKVAEDLGPTKEEREAALQKEEGRLAKKVVRDKSRGLVTGMLGGAALGGITGALAGGEGGRGRDIPGVYAGRLLGGGAGIDPVPSPHPKHGHR